MSFNISDKVVAVGHRAGRGEPALILFNSELYRSIGPHPVLNGVYVIDAVIDFPELGLVGLALVGSSAIHRASGSEVGWDSRQFRLLSEVQAENRLRAEKEASA